jgi:hypothetical protein
MRRSEVLKVCFWCMVFDSYGGVAYWTGSGWSCHWVMLLWYVQVEITKLKKQYSGAQGWKTIRIKQLLADIYYPYIYVSCSLPRLQCSFKRWDFVTYFGVLGLGFFLLIQTHGFTISIYMRVFSAKVMTSLERFCVILWGSWVLGFSANFRLTQLLRSK